MYYHIKEENNLPKALGYSSIVMAILVAIGFFIVFGQPTLPLDGMGGIVVNYGTSEVGAGDDFMSIEEPSMDENANNVQPDRVVPTETPTPTPSQQVSDKTVATQDMEDAPAVTKTEKATKNPAPETTKEVKNSTPAVNTNALYKGKKNNGKGVGDGEGGGVGNQGSNYGDPAASNYGEGGSGFGNTMIDLKNVNWTVSPNIEKIGQFQGKVQVQVRVDGSGNVVYVRVGGKGTQYLSSEVANMLERAFRGAKLNMAKNSNVREFTVPVNFKLQ